MGEMAIGASLAAAGALSGVARGRDPIFGELSAETAGERCEGVRGVARRGLRC